jgi:hypothetical protein
MPLAGSSPTIQASWPGGDDIGLPRTYLHLRAIVGDDLALKSMVLANMVGMLAHDELLAPPPGHTSEAYAEEIVNACLGYLDRSVEHFGDA